ncbi:MAG: FMN-binding protein [Bacteroidaceae bacterium]
MTVKQAAAAKVDAVTGATYSSTAVIQTMKATLKKISKQ